MRLAGHLVVVAALVFGQEYPFTPENVQDFVEKQFADFFTDCEAFVASFSRRFKYCDAEPDCLKKPDDLLELCLATEGTVNEIHTDLDIRPGTTPPPFYPQIAIVGKQTVCLDLGFDFGFGVLTPLCFEFVITEELKKECDNEFDLESVAWTGYYNNIIGTCPGFTPLNCSAP